MNDTTTTVAQLKKIVSDFVQERDWQQFHSPKNLSMGIVGEATELMEKFFWMSLQESYASVTDNRQEIEDEAADVLFMLLAFCNASSIDIAAAFEKKVAQTKQKYPVEKSKGVYTKNDKL